MTRRTPAVLAAAALGCITSSGVAGQTIRTVTSTRSWAGESALNVNVRFGVARFTMQREAGDQLYRANLSFNEDLFLPTSDYRRESSTLDLGLRTRRDENNNLEAEDQLLALTVNPEVSTTLNLQFGAGKAEIDLGGLRLASADISTGASDTEIDFSRPTTSPCEQLKIRVGAAALRATGLGNSNCAHLDIKGAAGSLTLDFTGEWQADQMTGEIALGLGGLTLRLPDDIGVSIIVRRFLAPFEADGFRREGNRYVTRNYGSASSKLDLRLEAFLGDVDVEWVSR